MKLKEKKLRVLLAEPLKSTRGVIKLLLEHIESVGEVIAVPSAVAALSILRNDSDFSIIITAVYFDDLDGFDFIKNLEIRDLLSIPIIMISSNSSIRNEAINSGAFAFLAKPLRLGDLRDVISQAADMIL